MRKYLYTGLIYALSETKPVHSSRIDFRHNKYANYLFLAGNVGSGHISNPTAGIIYTAE